MSTSAEATRLQRTIQTLLDEQRDDVRLRARLEGLRREPELGGLTWFWGPELYRRNRAVFREFILAHFADGAPGGPRGWRRVEWRRHAERLEGWLAEARRQRDTWLARRLWRWRLGRETGGIDNDAWCRELRRQYEAASSPAEQGQVLDEFDAWFRLDEPTALALYTRSRATAKFLLRHLPVRFSFWGNDRRDMWRGLIDLALGAGDEELALTLYRRQVSAAQWQRDVEELAGQVTDADRLNDELRKRHPEGWGLNLGDGVLSLLRRRGRDVLPYVRAHLNALVGGWQNKSAEPFLVLARERGWWDLWAAVVRATTDPKVFNTEMARVLADAQLDEATRVERLRALAGVSREWNGFVRIQPLTDDVAVKLYQRYPDLMRGPFKNVVPSWGHGSLRLLAAAHAAGDDELVDLLAIRHVMRVSYGTASKRGQKDEVLDMANRLVRDFQALRERDEAAFARRAANVLTQVPANFIYPHEQLLRCNDLARLLFVESFPAYLSVPAAVRDLVEASDIHVQALAYRVLAQDDDRARRLAVQALDILLGTLLRPLQRKTRLAAFGALANAAREDREAARRVLRRAREALRLPDKGYPKEPLLGLIGQVLHAWPALAWPSERPIVYGLVGAGV